MKHEIRRIPPFAAARIVGAVSGAAALLGILLTWLATFFLIPGSLPSKDAPAAVLVLAIPMGWWLAMYLATLIVCALYNLMARYVGGIRLVLGDSTEVQRTR